MVLIKLELSSAVLCVHNNKNNVPTGLVPVVLT